LVWDWPAATPAAIYALPGAVVILSDRSRGLALVLGVLPAAVVGMMPTRRGRLAIIALGTAIGFPILIGGLLADVPVLAVIAIAALAGCGATHRSRWYVTPAFTTFLVFMLLLYSRPQDAASRFTERLLETVLGVGIAYIFGLALPVLAQRLRRRRD
jgi:uncharacterized membrane protein YccC